MKQNKWLKEVDDPYKMLNFLGKRVSSRKARLFACACLRRSEPKLQPWEEKIVEIAERFADGQAARADLQQAEADSVGKSGVAWVTMDMDSWTAVEAARVAGEWRDEAQQCAWVRDVFGNPFRPVALHSSCLTSTVIKLAEAIYQEKAFHRLPILADALEEAGCANEDILNHCRQPGEHVRGCWPLDLILGKE